MKLKKIQINGEAGKPDQVTVIGDVPEIDAHNLMTSFKTPTRQSLKEVLKRFGTKYKKWQIILER